MKEEDGDAKKARADAVVRGGKVGSSVEVEQADSGRLGKLLHGGDALLDGTADGDSAGGRGAGRSLGYGGGVWASRRCL